MREDLVIEIVMRIVHHATTFAPYTISDIDVTAGLLLKHEGEVYVVKAFRIRPIPK